MTHDSHSPLTEQQHRRPGGTAFCSHDLVQMKPPAYPTRGVIVEDEPLTVGGVRYWRVAWAFGGEKRVAWSPESAILAL